MDSQLVITKESKANLATTWKIYKSHWKTFLSITGFGVLAFVIYIILHSILDTFGLAPMIRSEYDYVGTGAYIAALFIRTPIFLTFIIVSALLTTLFTVVPALYFKNQEIITWKVPYKVLKENFRRYFLAGILFNVCVLIGLLLCIIPGIVVLIVGPTYLNKIACSDMPIMKAFKSSFQAVYKSPNLLSYIGMQLLAVIIYLVPTICTCGIGGIITLPMISIYQQHLTYNKGLIN